MKEELLNNISSKINEEFMEFKQTNGFISLEDKLKNAKTPTDLKIIRYKLQNKKELAKNLSNESVKSLRLTKQGFINLFALVGILTTSTITGFLIGYLLYKFIV